MRLSSRQANTPYSEEKIQRSAAALKKAGNFPDVKVEVVPDITGLRVSFLLEPSFYLGVVEFPGAIKRFSYIRLLQVANLSDEDPYDPARVAVAEKSITDFLHKNGYFQATVHAKPSIDDSHELVNLTFAVDMGKQARIDSVRIDGPDQPENTQLLHAMQSLRARLSGALLKPGKPYSPSRITAATTQMKRILSKQRRFAGSIRENPPQFDSATNRVAVSFQSGCRAGSGRSHGRRQAFVYSSAGEPPDEEADPDFL